MITFLHTARINVKRFEDLIRKYDQEITIKHFVNEDLLQHALQFGYADGEAFQKEVDKVKEETAGMIICTCSSYGDECERICGIERIDKPVVEYLVQKYHRIGLAYTAKSTVPISTKLIENIAHEKQKKVQVIEIDCTSCWQYLEQGNTQQYEQEIAQIIKNDSSDIQAIFLAQASMENAKKHLTSYGKEVMASPDYGVQEYLKKVKNI